MDERAGAPGVRPSPSSVSPAGSGVTLIRPKTNSAPALIVTTTCTGREDTAAKGSTFASGLPSTVMNTSPA